MKNKYKVDVRCHPTSYLKTQITLMLMSITVNLTDSKHISSLEHCLNGT